MPLPPQNREAVNAYNAAAATAAKQQAQNYARTLAGYRAAQARYTTPARAIERGYTGLSKQVQANIANALKQQQLGQQQLYSGYDQMRDQELAEMEGLGGKRRQEITDNYAMATGNAAFTTAAAMVNGVTIRTRPATQSIANAISGTPAGVGFPVQLRTAVSRNPATTAMV